MSDVFPFDLHDMDAWCIWDLEWSPFPSRGTPSGPGCIKTLLSSRPREGKWHCSEISEDEVGLWCVAPAMGSTSIWCQMCSVSHGQVEKLKGYMSLPWLTYTYHNISLYISLYISLHAPCMSWHCHAGRWSFVSLLRSLELGIIGNCWSWR